MNLQKALYFLVSLILTAGIALAQQVAPAPPPPDSPPMALAPGDAPGVFSMFIGGGSFLGVNAEDISKENMGRYGLREARGVGITQVIKESPAEKAGLRKDDVILKFEGDSVTSVRKLTRLVSEVAPDQTARLSISRGGNEQEVSVTIGKRDNATNTFHRFQGFEGLEGLDKLKDFPQLKGFQGPEGFRNLPPGANVWKWEGQGPDGQGMVFAFGGGRRIGVSTTQLTKQLADYFGISDGKGVLVTSVSDDSPAAKAGIKAGDVITAIDGEKVEGAGDLSRAINKKKDGDVTLTVIHNKNQRTVTLTPTEAKPSDTPMIAPGARSIVIPSINLGSIPEMNISIPQMNLPVIPEINIQVPGKVRAPKVRVIKSTDQPI